MAALTYLPVTGYIIITLDLPQHDFETNIGKAGPALNDDLCVQGQVLMETHLKSLKVTQRQ